MTTYMYKNKNYGLERLEDGAVIIRCFKTNRKAWYAPAICQGFLDTIEQQEGMGHSSATTLERIGQTIDLKGGFF